MGDGFGQLIAKKSAISGLLNLGKYDPMAWEQRFKEPSWKLREMIEWFCTPREWGESPFPERIFPKDIEAYRENIREIAMSAIKERTIQCFYDGRDHWINPLQIIALFYVKSFRGFVMPKACRGFFEAAKQRMVTREINRSVKCIKRPGAKKDKVRSDQFQMIEFRKAVKTSIDKKLPVSYYELLQREEIVVSLNLFVDARGNPKILDDQYLKRKISDLMPLGAKKPGRRTKKSCKVDR